MIQYNNFDQCPVYEALKKSEKADLKKLLTAERINRYEAPIAAGLSFHYGCSPLTNKTIELLQQTAEDRQLVEKYRALLTGERINTGEKRKVLHQLTRGACCGTVNEDGKDIGAFYKEQLNRLLQFAAKVHAGEIKGSTGKAFQKVIQIGIGGSDLGPRAIYLALKEYAIAQNSLKMEADFISNVDPDDATAVLNGVDFETTLFILVSKSGTTQETLTNQNFVLDKIRQASIEGMNPSAHMVTVTSETSPLANSDSFLDSFYIDDYIGGRYSSCSAVGGVLLSLAFGGDLFQQFLEGAHQADLASLEPDIKKNGTLMDALIGVWQRLHGMGTTAVLPYSQALSRFPAHLQQLDMESNGKSVNRFGEKVAYATGPTLLGEPGTNGQHSFYQHLHQGTDVIPLQFIGFKQNQSGVDFEEKGATGQQKLNANLAAQIIAFALGAENEDPNKAFAGNRYSTLIVGDKLTPQALGALLAHFENKVMFQGFVWNLNSFDQEGVQLGKRLTGKVLSGEMSEALKAYADKLGL